MKLLGKRNKPNRTMSLSDYPDLLEVGDIAPDFSMQAVTGVDESISAVTLSDLRGHPVVLVFYPKDGTPVCSSQLALYNEAFDLIDEHKASMLGISVDDTDTHQAFARRLKLGFPLLSDDGPPGSVARAYGVFNEDDGLSERALFVLDAEGVIRWREVAPRGVNPGMDGILSALEALDPEGD